MNKLAFAEHDARHGKGTLPVSENIYEISFGVPWFKHFNKDIIDKYASGFRKVIENYEELLTLQTV